MFKNIYRKTLPRHDIGGKVKALSFSKGLNF